MRVFVTDAKNELRLGMPASVHLAVASAAGVGDDQTHCIEPAMNVERPNGNGTALLARGLRKTFRRGADQVVVALDDVSIEVAHGTLTALVGPDGGGKTTLIRLAAGLMSPDAGELHVLGFDARVDPQQIQSRIGYMPQRFGLYEDLTLQENLDLYADLHGLTRDQRGSALSALDGDDRPGALHPSPGGAAFGRDETKAGAGLHAGALAGVAGVG